MNDIPPLTLKEYYEKHTEVMVLLRGISGEMANFTASIATINDRISKNESRTDISEKNVLNLQNEMKTLAEKLGHEIEKVNQQSIDRWTMSQEKIDETNRTLGEMRSDTKTKTTIIENSKTFLWRWGFIAVMGFVFTVIGLVLAKTGILNLK